MSETLDEIVRALADPERFVIASILARGSTSARMLAELRDVRRVNRTTGGVHHPW